MKQLLIIFLPLAQVDFDEAFDYYDKINSKLADEFREKVEEKLLLIKQFPGRYPKRYGRYRETKVKRFPYLIVYSYNTTKNIITISAVYHTARNPKSKYRK